MTPIPGETMTFEVLTRVGTFMTPTAVSGNNGRANAVFTGPAGVTPGSESVVRAAIAGGDTVVIISWGP